jgi:hypothetical protein
MGFQPFFHSKACRAQRNTIPRIKMALAMRVFLSGFDSEQISKIAASLQSWAEHFGQSAVLVNSAAESDVIVLDSDQPIFETLDPQKRTLAFGQTRVYGVREHHAKPVRSFQLAAMLFQH